MVAILSEGNILPEGSLRYKEFTVISEIVGSVRSKVTDLGAEYAYTGSAKTPSYFALTTKL